MITRQGTTPFRKEARVVGTESLSVSGTFPRKSTLYTASVCLTGGHDLETDKGTNILIL